MSSKVFIREGRPFAAILATPARGYNDTESLAFGLSVQLSALLPKPGVAADAEVEFNLDDYAPGPQVRFRFPVLKDSDGRFAGRDVSFATETLAAMGQHLIDLAAALPGLVEGAVAADDAAHKAAKEAASKAYNDALRQRPLQAKLGDAAAAAHVEQRDAEARAAEKAARKGRKKAAEISDAKWHGVSAAASDE